MNGGGFSAGVVLLFKARRHFVEMVAAIHGDALAAPDRTVRAPGAPFASPRDAIQGIAKAARLTSPTPQRMHDLDHIAIGEQAFGMASARNDLAVDLHRDPAFGQALGDQQVGEGAGGG